MSQFSLFFWMTYCAYTFNFWQTYLYNWQGLHDSIYMFHVNFICWPFWDPQILTGAFYVGNGWVARGCWNDHLISSGPTKEPKMRRPWKSMYSPEPRKEQWSPCCFLANGNSYAFFCILYMYMCIYYITLSYLRLDLDEISMILYRLDYTHAYPHCTSI